MGTKDTEEGLGFRVCPSHRGWRASFVSIGSLVLKRLQLWRFTMMMHRRSLTTLAAGAFVVASGMLGMGQPAPVGYDDTPMQPNGKWHIHDGKRPQPPVVTPPPANPT